MDVANIIKGPDILYLCIFIFYFSVSSSEDDEPNIAVSKHLEMPEGKHKFKLKKKTILNIKLKYWSVQIFGFFTISCNTFDTWLNTYINP